VEQGFLFEKLKIYQRSLAFSIKICKISSIFPFKFSRIGGQLIGAAISVPLNIAEGSGRKFSKERVNFYNISRSSLFECVPILEICLELNLIDQKVYKELMDETVELSKMINAFISSTQSPSTSC
jgi:four helix bundle protein